MEKEDLNEELELGAEDTAAKTDAADEEISELDALQRQLAELNDKYLRMAAEYEN